MTEEQITHMVSRFLRWRLPETFSPDGGISFKRTYNEHTAHPMRHEPVGTNLTPIRPKPWCAICWMGSQNHPPPEMPSMTEIDEFTDALLRANWEYLNGRKSTDTEWSVFRVSWAATSPPPALLAVASVALERAAEKIDADFNTIPLAAMSTEYFNGYADGVAFALRSVQALMPDKVEGLLPVEGERQ